MRDSLFRLTPGSGHNLQAQIRELLVNAILDGQLPPNSALPSGRKMAQQLKVARNTVVLAYQQLVDEGYLEARERSGYYVSADILSGRVTKTAPAKTMDAFLPDWRQRMVNRFTHQTYTKKPANWRDYTYPFVYGQFDPALFPIHDWRECSRESVSVAAIYDWAGDRIDRDDPLLVEQIHIRLLPRRGVWANKEDILVTVGAQQALFLVAELLVDASTTVGMENPGYPDARNVLAARTPNLIPLPVDAEGVELNESLRNCDYVYVTPSHQHPTTVTMSLERRQALLALANEYDFVIIEDDYEAETNYVGEPTPALKSLDKNERVIYIGSLSKTLAPGLRMGYLVAPPAIIQESRALRRLMVRHPPANNQHIVAQFIKRGHHDSLVRRLTHAYRERWQILGNALQEHLPDSYRIPTFGGTAYWVCCSDDINTELLLQRTKREGLLFEPGRVFFSGKDSNRNSNYLRLGFSSVPADKINPGIMLLARYIGDLTKD